MNTQAPGYLARLALRAKQPVTGMRPRTAGMFESETARPRDPFGESVDLSTPTQQGQGLRTADVEGRWTGLRPVQRQVETMPSPAGAEIPAHVVRSALDGAVSAAVLTPAPSFRTIETSATATHREATAPSGLAGAKPADLRKPNGENGLHQLPRQKTSDAAGAADLPPASRGTAAGTPDLVWPAPGQLSTPVVAQPPGSQPPSGEPAPRQSALPPPDPPGLPRLNPSKPEPAAPAAGVTVTIGRIEVLPPASDKPPRKPPRPRARPATAPQLSDYLRQRRDGG